jgi:hypothetical protein
MFDCSEDFVDAGIGYHMVFNLVQDILKNIIPTKVNFIPW